MRLAVLGLCAAVLTLSGCKEVDIKNGEVPDQYLEQVRKYMGVYPGKMDGRAANLRFDLVGKKVVAQYNDRKGTDILGNNCASVIGNLRKVYVKKSSSSYKVTGASFSFNPNRCIMVQGNTVEMSFKETGSGARADVSIYLETETERWCTIGGYPPREHCTYEQRPIYTTGRFTK